MLIFKYGNILDSKCYALVNTVNIVGVMGKGIALQFRNEFPHNYSIYRKACQYHRLKVGELLMVKDISMRLGERLIINFPTKTHWRLPSEYAYIEQGLTSVSTLIADQHIKHIAIPALGCGNGSLDWKKVRPMICQHLTKLDALIEIYEPADG